MIKSKVIYTYILPGFICIYLAMVATQLLVLKRSEEIFPFFSWSLFSHIPTGDAIYSFMEVVDIDGEKQTDLLVAAHNHRRSTNVGKAVRKAIKLCDSTSRSCPDSIASLMQPYFDEGFKYSSLTFNLIRCKIDMEPAIKRISEADSRLPVYGSVSDCKSYEAYGPVVITKE